MGLDEEYIKIDYNSVDIQLKNYRCFILKIS